MIAKNGQSTSSFKHCKYRFRILEIWITDEFFLCNRICCPAISSLLIFPPPISEPFRWCLKIVFDLVITWIDPDHWREWHRHQNTKQHILRDLMIRKIDGWCSIYSYVAKFLSDLCVVWQGLAKRRELIGHAAWRSRRHRENSGSMVRVIGQNDSKHCTTILALAGWIFRQPAAQQPNQHGVRIQSQKSGRFLLGSWSRTSHPSSHLCKRLLEPLYPSLS